MGYVEEYYYHGMNFDRWNLESLEELIRFFGAKKFLVKGMEMSAETTSPSEIAQLEQEYPHSEEEMNFFNTYDIYNCARTAYDLRVAQNRGVPKVQVSGEENCKKPAEPQAL